MLTPDKMNAAMHAVTDQLDAVLKAHEREDHAGGQCVGSRISAVAFIAHWIGINTFRSSWQMFLDAVKDYETNCPGCQKVIAEGKDL